MHRISIVPCSDYDPKTVRPALEAVLAPLGGLDWVTPGMTVAIKANLVSMMKPERAATTHPALLCALVEMLCERGAKPIVGDSPGGLYNAAFLNRVYSATGMKAVEAAGAKLNQNYATKDARFENALVAKSFTYTAYLDEADAIIDFCKLKTHGMMGMSAAAKNMFGVVPGTFKPEYHFRFPDHLDFAKMLVDLNSYFADKTKLCLVDAVVGMEGNGPTQGTPRKIGALLAAKSAHALDLTCAHVIGIDPETVPTLQVAMQSGMIPSSVNDLEIIGDLSAFCIADYENIPVHKSMKFEGRGKFAAMFVRTSLQSRPKPDRKKCIGCKECAKICPAKVITMKNGIPVIDRKKCITCFCCQEFCPVGAMKVHRPLVAKIINRKKEKP
ncbi:MAG: DUF362 domain-containing protein [Ruminococcaceae bacterium]|nr:DUF362 domain-containing protein [Oscillospiraceae bacterium]